MNLHAPYPFKQPPDRKAVAALAAQSNLGQRLKDARCGLAVAREHLQAETPRRARSWGGGLTVYTGASDDARTAILKTLARLSEDVRELEAALRKIIHEAVEGEDVRDLNYTQARCPRCHHPAPAVSAWGRMGRLILFHDAGSMTCSGVGEQVPR